MRGIAVWGVRRMARYVHRGEKATKEIKIRMGRDMKIITTA